MKRFLPLLIVVGACLLRILWVLFVFPLHPSLPFLILCFPISWLVVSIVNGEYLWRLVRDKRGN